jgi:hypothetical protein
VTDTIRFMPFGRPLGRPKFRPAHMPDQESSRRAPIAEIWAVAAGVIRILPGVERKLVEALLDSRVARDTKMFLWTTTRSSVSAPSPC